MGKQHFNSQTYTFNTNNICEVLLNCYTDKMYSQFEITSQDRNRTDMKREKCKHCMTAQREVKFKQDTRPGKTICGISQFPVWVYLTIITRMFVKVILY